MSDVTKFESSTALTKELPQSGDIIVMNALEGWDDLQEEQRAYLSTYFDTFPKRIKACMESGISTGSYNNWINNDSEFNQVMKLIEFIHLEELKDLEYAESYTDPKTRSRFLKAMESGGYGPNDKQVNNNTLNIEVKGMNEAMDVVDELSNS